MLLFPERQGCLGCHEGIEEIRESGSIMLMQAQTLAKRSVTYMVPLLATVADQRDWPPKYPIKGKEPHRGAYVIVN